MSEEKKNMEDLLQSELDLGDTEAVGAADNPFANIGANDDPFAGVNGTEDTFVDIENDNNNPFNDVAAEKTTEAGEMTAEGTGTEAVSETGVSEDAPAKSEMIKKPEKTGVEETEHKEKAVDNNANVQDEQKISDKSGEQSSSNPFEAEIDRVETKAAEETKTGLLNKPPVFKYAGATEDITDLSQTFEAIRKAKAEDFPELEDGNRVSWKMDYCGVVKNVAQPTKTTIAEQKKLIEESKDFLTAIKRKKGDFSCKVIPTVTAQKKGQMPVYKGIFSNEEKALNSGKAIAYVPSDDGNVYEIRKNEIGIFRAKANKIRGLTKVRAGFTPALPLIPFDMLSEIIDFFRYFADRKNICEALVNVYWDAENKRYIVKVPEQKVGAAAVDTVLPDVEDDLIHVMDIHSHNYMKAYFSETDDRDEKATRIYTVIGRLDKMLPDIKMRISVGGKFEEINPMDMFEYPFDDFPSEWLDNVTEYKDGGVFDESKQI